MPFQSPPGMRGRSSTPQPFPNPGDGSGAHRHAPRSHPPADGVVVPAPLRSSPPPAASVPPPRISAGGGTAVDPAARQRAMEAMARKLGMSPRPKTPDLVIPTAPVPVAIPVDPERAAEERRLRALQVVEQGEERQKAGDLSGALECFRNAEKIYHDDPSIRLRIDAVTNLAAMQRVNACIDQAREAMRKGDAQEAARCWEKAWEGRKNDPTLLYNAAEVLTKYSTDYRRAADFAQRAILGDPKMVRAYVILAEAFLAANLKTSARGAIENLAKVDPNHASLKTLREKVGPLSLAETLGLKR